MTFGAQEAKKKRHATSREKALNKVFMVQFFLEKGNYEYEHNSIRIDTEQDGFFFCNK